MIDIDKPIKTIHCQRCNENFSFHSKEEFKKWDGNKRVCVHCESQFCDKPKTEADLFILQTDYLNNRISHQDLESSKGTENYKLFIKKKHISDKALFQVMDLLKSYSESLLRKKFKNATRDAEEMAGYIDRIALLMLEKYLSKPDFFVNGSFWGYLYNVAREVIYDKKELSYDKQAELKGVDLISLDLKYTDSNETIQVEDSKYDKMVGGYVESYETILLLKDLKKVVEYSSEKIENPYVCILSLLSIMSLVMSSGKSEILSFFGDVQVKQNTESIMEAIKKVLKNSSQATINSDIETILSKLRKSYKKYLRSQNPAHILDIEFYENKLKEIDSYSYSSWKEEKDYIYSHLKSDVELLLAG